jgi:hypothetical protein
MSKRNKSACLTYIFGAYENELKGPVGAITSWNERSAWGGTKAFDGFGEMSRLFTFEQASPLCHVYN